MTVLTFVNRHSVVHGLLLTALEV